MKMFRENIPAPAARASSKALPPPLSQLLANRFRDQVLVRIVLVLATIRSIMRQVTPAILAGGTSLTVMKTCVQTMGRLRDGFVSSAAAASAFSGTAGTIGGKLRTVADAVTFTASRLGKATWGWFRNTAAMDARRAASIAVATARRLVSTVIPDTTGPRALSRSRHIIPVAAHWRCSVRQKALQAWPLWSVLAAQLVLTVPWLWRTAPFTDEARYLAAGHKEWAHWLHHTMLPDYGLSGAPVLYPPLGAAADSAGGLVAARGLSLIFMLGATAAVYSTGSRLFGRWAAFSASALFAVLGLVVHYGAFATYDAMALFFLVLGVWAAVHVREGGHRWIAGCAVALVAANAAKYATLAWDPVVAGIVTLHGWDKGVAKALRQACALALSVALLDVGLLAAGGPHYVHALLVTTVSRSVRWGALSSPAGVLWRAFAMTGVLVLPAALGPAMSAARRNPLPFTCLLGLLVLAAFIAPADQAHIRQLPSLDKNMGFGMPFAALAAGYAISAGIDWLEERLPAGRPAGSIAAAALIILALVAGREQTVQFRGPSSAVATQIISAIKHGYQHGTYIASDGAPWMEKYYLPQIPARAWMGIFDPPVAQRARFRARICAGLVSVVILRIFRHSYHRSYDFQVQKMMEFSRRYLLAVATSQGNYATQVWRLKSHAGGESCQ